MMIASKYRREAWISGSTGSFSTDRDVASWKLLQKTPVPGKMCMFLWRLARHSLPTEDVRAHRKMSTTNTCALCGVADSWRHLLMVIWPSTYVIL
uniref:Reverse transcriptase zinc-binding domain-containing protein n=1 Tax=Aegilops tauschii subsp. strangulata TaxID=200361 RepID=A0A453GKE3_AEGTS